MTRAAQPRKTAADGLFAAPFSQIAEVHDAVSRGGDFLFSVVNHARSRDVFSEKFAEIVEAFEKILVNRPRRLDFGGDFARNEHRFSDFTGNITRMNKGTQEIFADRRFNLRSGDFCFSLRALRWRGRKGGATSS